MTGEPRLIADDVRGRCRLYGGTPPCPDADDSCRTGCVPSADYVARRRHLVEVHGYTADYFDHDYKMAGPVTDAKTLLWLHQPWEGRCEERIPT